MPPIKTTSKKPANKKSMRGRGRPPKTDTEKTLSDTPRVSFQRRHDVMTWWGSLNAKTRGELLIAIFDASHKT